MNCLSMSSQLLSCLSPKIRHIFFLLSQLLTHKPSKVLLFYYSFFLFHLLLLLYKSFLFLDLSIMVHPLLSLFCCWNLILRWRIYGFSPITFLRNFNLRACKITMCFSCFWRSKLKFFNFCWLERLLFAFQLIFKLFLQKFEIRNWIGSNNNFLFLFISFL